MKKAQGLALRTVIIAIIMISLLVMLSFLLVQQMPKLTKGTTDCTAQGAKCLDSRVKCFDDGGQPVQFTCPENKPVCCQL